MRSSESSQNRLLDLPRPIACTYLLSIFSNVSTLLQLSSLPHLVKQLGLSDADYGYIQTIFNLFQLVGAPYFGHIIQKFELRCALFICYGSTFFSNLGLFLSSNYLTLLLSIVPAFFMHAPQGYQTLLSTLTNPGRERTSSFGVMGLTFGAGSMIGPVLSIVSTKLFGSTAPFIVSTMLSMISCLIFDLFIDESSYKKTEPTQGVESKMSLSNIITTIQKPNVLNVLLKKNGPIIPFHFMMSIVNIYVIDKFQTTNTEDQIMQVFIGILIIFSNGFGVIWLRKTFDEQKLLVIGSISFTIGFFLLTLIFFNFWMLLIIMPFLSFGMSVVATCSDSLLTSLVSQSEQGVVLGTATSLNFFIRTFSPLFAGFLLQNYGFQSISLLGIMGSLFSLGLMLFFPINEKMIMKHKEE